MPNVRPLARYARGAEAFDGVRLGLETGGGGPATWRVAATPLALGGRRGLTVLAKHPQWRHTTWPLYTHPEDPNFLLAPQRWMVQVGPHQRHGGKDPRRLDKLTTLDHPLVLTDRPQDVPDAVLT